MKFPRLYLILIAALSGWAALPGAAAAPYRPLWIEQPKSDDSIYLYRIGTAVAGSEAAARQAALENAGQLILDEILTQQGVVEPWRSELRGELAPRRVEALPDAVHFEPEVGGLRGWIQVSFPLAERARLQQEIAAARERRKMQEEFDARINLRWQEGKAASLRGEYDTALALLVEVETNYAQLRAPAGELEELRMLMGDVQQALRNPLAARGFYETVAGMSTAAIWQAQARERLDALPPPPRCWPMQARWQGRAVAQVCVFQAPGQAAVWFGELAGVLHRDFQECRMTLHDLADWQPEAAAQLFDTRQTESLARAAQAVHAGIALVIHVRTDDARPDQPQAVMGIRMPTPDTTIQFMVVDAAGNRIVYDGKFREMRGQRSNARLAERIAAILINNYLAPKCPALASGPGHAPPGPD